MSDSTSQKQHYIKVIHKHHLIEKSTLSTSWPLAIDVMKVLVDSVSRIHASRYTHPERFSSELHQGTHTQRDSAVSCIKVHTPSSELHTFLCKSGKRKLCVSAMRVICTTFITPHSHHTGRQNLATQEVDVVLNVMRLHQ